MRGRNGKNGSLKSTISPRGEDVRRDAIHAEDLWKIAALLSPPAHFAPVELSPLHDQQRSSSIKITTGYFGEVNVRRERRC
jgi:hypothetical protein